MSRPVGDGQWRVVVDGIAHRVFAAGPDDAPWIWLDGVVYRPEVADTERPARARSRDTSGSLSAPMPATVRAIAVAPGDRVARGDTLIVLEAMKMELPLKSPVDGVVVSIACQVGDLVQPGIPLVELAMSRPPLPRRVTVVEVGPRDGLQNEAAQVPDVDQDRLCRGTGGGRTSGHRDRGLRQSRARAADGRCESTSRAASRGGPERDTRRWCPICAASPRRTTPG